MCSVEQVRGVIDHRAFDGQHLQLGDDAAIGGKSTRLAASGEYAVAWHHDRTGIAAERLPDIPRQLDAAEPLGDIAIGRGLARRNAAGDVIDAAMELRNAVEIERHVVEIVRLALKQRDHALDGVLYFGRRRRLRDVAIALEDAGTGLVLASHRQLYPVDAARAPHDPATAD